MKMENLLYILASIVGTGGALFSGFKAFSSITENERGVRTFLGKAKRDKETGKVVVYQPGGKWMLPFLHQMVKLRIKGNLITYENLTITLKNNLTYKFNAFITYDVKDDPDAIEHILFNEEDRDHFVGNHFLKSIQKVLHKTEELDLKTASARLMKEVSPRLEEKGWTVTDCDIMLFAETAVSQFLRGVDYRIQKALEYQDQLSPKLLCAALGVSAVVTVDDEDKEFKFSSEELAN